jgi:tetratricopeptide (TPR) repeat protein
MITTKPNRNGLGKTFSRAVRFDQQPADAWHNLGICRAGQGRDVEAVACFEKAIQLQPDFAQARQALGLTLVGMGSTHKVQGRVREAAACFRRASEIAPQEAGAWNNLGVVLLEQGDGKGAADLFRRAVDLDSGFAEAYTNLALALELQGEFGAAADVMAQLVIVCPHKGQGWRHMGMMRFYQGDMVGASEALWKGLSLDLAMDHVDEIFLVLLQAGMHLGHCSKKAAGTWIARLRALDPQSPLPDLLDYGICSLTPQTAIPAWQKAACRLEQTEIPVESGLGAIRREASLNQAPARSAVLLNFGRSATGFLHSLIDGHPQVTTMPGIYMKDFFSRGVWEAVTDPNPNVMAENFCSLYEVLFDARIPINVPGSNKPANFPIGVSEGFTRMGEDGDEALGLNRDRFRRSLADLLQGEGIINSGRFFTQIHAAFELAQGRQSAPDLLFYHIHNPDHFTFMNFLRQFPGCRILLIVREPLQSLESWISKIIEEPGAYPEIVNRVVRMLFALDRPEFSLFPAAGVRLEDLKEDPDATLGRLCRFIGIHMAPHLKRSTMQGLRWWGDPGSVRLEKKDPFGRMPDDPTDRKIGSILSEGDQLVLDTLFFPFSLRFGYPSENGATFQRNLQRIRPLLDRPFDFERRYAEAFPQSIFPLEQNHFCGYLRRLLILRWETLVGSGTYPGLLSPI